MASARPRVAIVGGMSEWSLSDSAARAFEQLGCTTEIVPLQNWRPRLARPAVPGVGAALRVLESMALPGLEARLLTRIARFRPSVVLVIKNDDLHASTYRAIRALGARVAAFHPDDPFRVRTLLRRGPAHRRAATQMRESDVYFVWSSAFVAPARRAGARRVEYLPFACEPLLHTPTAPAEPERNDVAFIGNWDAERERWLGAIAAARQPLAIWGETYWGTRCEDARLREAWRGRALFAGELADEVARTKINLNILRVQNKDACNMRTFEIPCSGGFMLHERSRDLPGLFRPGKECDDFGSESELVAKIGFYLQNDDARRRIARAGHEAALRQTYRQWAERVLSAAHA